MTPQEALTAEDVKDTFGPMLADLLLQNRQQAKTIIKLEAELAVLKGNEVQETAGAES